MSNDEKVMEEARQALERWGVGYIEIKTLEDAQYILTQAPEIDAKVARAKDLAKRAKESEQELISNLESLGADTGETMQENHILTLLEAFGNEQKPITPEEIEALARAAFAVDATLGQYVHDTLTFVNSDYFRRILAKVEELRQFLIDNVDLYRFDDGLEVRAQDPEAVDTLGEIEGYLAQEIERRRSDKTPFETLRDGTDRGGRILDGNDGRTVKEALERMAITGAAEEVDPREVKKAMAAAEDVGALPAIAGMPNSPVIQSLLRFLASLSGGRLPQESRRNRHEKLTITQKAGVYTFTQTNEQSGNTIIIEIDQIDEYMKSKTAFSKMLIFTLQKMAAQNFPRCVGFPLRELVDYKIYTNNSNARKAIGDFFLKQKRITLKGVIKNGRETIKEKGGVLFYDYEIENNFVTLWVNENFNLDFLATFFSIFPRFAYSLKANAFLLVYQIFFLARQKQNRMRIKDNGYFTISLEAIREYMGLPSVGEVKNRRYKQLIKDPIETAIEAVEEAILQAPEVGEASFTITPHGTDKASIEEWLQGYLEIGLSDSFAGTFVAITDKEEASRKKAEKAKQAAIAKLEARAEAKKAGA